MVLIQRFFFKEILKITWRGYDSLRGTLIVQIKQDLKMGTCGRVCKRLKIEKTCSIRLQAVA